MSFAAAVATTEREGERGGVGGRWPQKAATTELKKKKKQKMAG